MPILVIWMAEIITKALTDRQTDIRTDYCMPRGFTRIIIYMYNLTVTMKYTHSCFPITHSLTHAPLILFLPLSLFPPFFSTCQTLCFISHFYLPFSILFLPSPTLLPPFPFLFLLSSQALKAVKAPMKVRYYPITLLLLEHPTRRLVVFPPYHHSSSKLVNLPETML